MSVSLRLSTVTNYIITPNPVGIIDVFVDELDLGKLGFDGFEPAVTGRVVQLIIPGALFSRFIFTVT
jgi:hypothetical protein